MSNAILICRICKGETDKGCPAQPGQDDSAFICPPCQEKIDAPERARRAAASAAMLAEKAPTLEVKP